MSIVLISHDLAVVASLADRIAVMYAGRVVESAPSAELLRGPRHPYSALLMQCVPDLRRPRTIECRFFPDRLPAPPILNAAAPLHPAVLALRSAASTSDRRSRRCA